MTRREAPRAGLLKALVAGRVTGGEVVAALHLSERQGSSVPIGVSESSATRIAPENHASQGGSEARRKHKGSYKAPIILR